MITVVLLVGGGHLVDTGMRKRAPPRMSPRLDFSVGDPY